MTKISEILLLWYHKNKRDLPWRHTTDPYRIWLSEIILQQTRVNQGLSYYYKFIDLFPTVFDLANASEDEVLKAWQGLGYYSRARNLHFTARKIVEEKQGVFPKNYEGLLQLKGVGTYTAAAIASFAYNEKVPAIDGNVIRVFSRLFGVDLPVDSAEAKKRINEIAMREIDDKHAGTYNQAIMEFGAIWCTPQRPKCDDCPFSANCIALQKTLVQKIPFKKGKTKVTEEWFYYLVASNNGSIYLKRRNEKDIWQGLYDFIEIRSFEPIEQPEVISRFSKLIGQNFTNTALRFSDEVTHLLSHRKIRARFIRVELTEPLGAIEQPIFAVAKEDVVKYGLPKLIERYWSE